MSKPTSFFLDVLRVVAAFIVFANHCCHFWSPAFSPFMERLAHGAVIVFFVLSGYVITYSTLSKSESLKTYTIARLSRLYSVVIPALLLTFILFTIGRANGPELYASISRGPDALRYFLTLGFLQNIWQLSASPPSNNPLWSLSYEFWYYALFGVAVFTRSRARIILLALIALIVGPNILLLLPCWILGVILCLVREKMRMPGRAAFFGYLFSACAMIGLIGFMRNIPDDLGHKPLLFSGAFLSDWIKALAVFFNIFFYDRAFSFMTLPPVLRSSVKFCSDHTFSLYLYHYPMIVFVTAVKLVGPDSRDGFKALVSLAILLLVFLLSAFTESKRALWRKLFGHLWDAGKLNRFERLPLATRLKQNQL